MFNRKGKSHQFGCTSITGFTQGGMARRRRFSTRAIEMVSDYREGPHWVKNGPDALEMGCLYYPRKQTSVSYANELRCPPGVRKSNECSDTSNLRQPERFSIGASPLSYSTGSALAYERGRQFDFPLAAAPPF